MDHADPPLAGSLEPLHDSLAGTDAGLGEKYTMNAHRTSTEMGWGRGTAPFPRPHPQKQNAAVYTKVWTHLIVNKQLTCFQFVQTFDPARFRHFSNVNAYC